jgi:hypothetical protein
MFVVLLHGCNPPEATEIARRSKYFAGAGHPPGSTTIAFSNVKPGIPYSGFVIGFALQEDGSSELPFAMVQ